VIGERGASWAAWGSAGLEALAGFPQQVVTANAGGGEFDGGTGGAEGSRGQ
jgi:hypothetical protein